MPAAAAAKTQSKASVKPPAADKPKLRLVPRPNQRPKKHEHADGHKLFYAHQKYFSKRRIDALEESYEASGEVACRRIREFAWDLGAELNWEYGWKAMAADRLGLGYTTMWNIIQGVVTTISTRTVDHVALRSGVPVGVFYDSEA